MSKNPIIKRMCNECKNYVPKWNNAKFFFNDKTQWGGAIYWCNNCFEELDARENIREKINDNYYYKNTLSQGQVGRGKKTPIGFGETAI